MIFRAMANVFISNINFNEETFFCKDVEIAILIFFLIPSYIMHHRKRRTIQALNILHTKSEKNYTVMDSKNKTLAIELDFTINY